MRPLDLCLLLLSLAVSRRLRLGCRIAPVVAPGLSTSLENCAEASTTPGTPVFFIYFFIDFHPKDQKGRPHVAPDPVRPLAFPLSLFSATHSTGPIQDQGSVASVGRLAAKHQPQEGAAVGGRSRSGASWLDRASSGSPRPSSRRAGPRRPRDRTTIDCVAGAGLRARVES